MSATGFIGTLNNAYMSAPSSISGYAGPTGGNWMEWTVHANTIKAVGSTGATGTTMTLSVPSGGIIQSTIGVTGAMVLTDSSVSIGRGAIVTERVEIGSKWSLVTTAPTANAGWYGVAVSSTGQYQTAVVQAGNNSGGLYTSSDYGVTWTLNGSAPSTTDAYWFSVAMSSDGLYQTAVARGIYKSSNSGVTWALVAAANGAPTNAQWSSVAMSSSGQYQTAVVQNGGGIYRSVDSGVTWTLNTSVAANWYGVAMSSTGQYQTAVVYNGGLYTNSNYGSGTWALVAAANGAPTNAGWYSVAMSSTGQYQTAVVNPGGIYTSSNYGTTWTLNGSAPTTPLWYSVAMSGSGQYQTAMGYASGIYTSNNYGATWARVSTANGAPTGAAWIGIAMSSTGLYQTALVNGGGIYTTLSQSSNNVYIGVDTSASRPYSVFNEVAIGPGVQGAGSNTVTMGVNASVSTLTSTGLRFNTGSQTIAIITTSYDTSTLIATLNYTAGSVVPLAGQLISVTGVAVSGYNGTFTVITATSTSLTVQNLYGGGLATSSILGTITIIAPTTQGLTFGDSTFSRTNRGPLITIITSNSAVAGTPMASGNYITPIGAKYLRVRMVGAGGGGNNYIVANASRGGYTQFGTYIAYGGQIGVLSTNTTYWDNGTYPYQCGRYQGGLGGGVWQAVSYDFESSSWARLYINTAISNLIVSTQYNQFITLNGFAPDSWNGTYQVLTSTSSTITIGKYYLDVPAITTYGIFVLSPVYTDTNTIYIPGGQGGSGGYTTSGFAVSGAMGGCSAFGFNNAGTIRANPAGGNAAQPPFPLGSFVFGGGGQGGSAVVNNAPGNGGGGGMYIETTIQNPATSYTVNVGLGGSGGGGDPSVRYNSAPGLNGVIVVEAYFN